MSEQIVIEWSRDKLRVALVESHGRHFKIRAGSVRDFPQLIDASVPAATVGAEVKGWLEAVGIQGEEAIVVLPRDSVVIRRLQLPAAPEDELPELVRFQAATKVSTPIEQLVLDYLLLPQTDPSQGLSVVAFSLDRDQLARLTGVLRAAGLQVTSVTASPLTVARLVQYAGHLELGIQHPELIVFQSGIRLEIGIFDQGTLVLSHGTQIPSNSPEERLRILKTELARLLVAQAQLNPTNEIGRCYLIGEDPDSVAENHLRERFQDKFARLDIATLVPDSPFIGFETLLGACVPTDPQRLHINFISPRKRREVPDRKKLYLGVGTALALLLVTAAYLVFQSKQSALESSIASLVEREVDLDKQLKSGDPRTVAHGRVAAWEGTHVDPVAIWTALQAQLPGTDRIYFTEVKITPQKGEGIALFVCTGQSRQRRDVEEMYQKLAENGFRVTPSPTRTNTRDPDYPIQFDLNVLLLRPNGSSAPAAGRTSGTSPSGGATIPGAAGNPRPLTQSNSSASSTR